jgi:repressor LexA
MMHGLTAHQAKLLAFIRAYSSQHAFAPSFREMMDGIGNRSTSGIHRLLSGLEERGYIRRQAHQKRCIILLDAMGLDRASTEALIAELERRGVQTSRPTRESAANRPVGGAAGTCSHGDPSRQLISIPFHGSINGARGQRDHG